MKKNILKKIKSGEVKMEPKWKFQAIEWAEIGGWLLSVGIVFLSVLSVGYFIEIYNPRELVTFGELGWQIFYEDFPYIWGFVAISCLVLGNILWINTGRNYKKSWQKNLTVMLGIVLTITVLVLYLKP